MSLLEERLRTSGPRPAPLIWVHPLDLQIESKPIKRLRSSEAGSLAQTEKNPSAPRPEKFKRQAPPTSLQNEAQQPFTRPTGPVLPAKRTRPVNVPSEPRRFTPLEASTAPNPPTKLAILAALGAELFDLESWRKRQCVTEIPSLGGPAPLARFAYPVSSLRTDDDAPNSSHKSQDGSDAGDRRAGSSRRLSTSTSSDILETSTEQMLAGMYSSGTFHRDPVAR